VAELGGADIQSTFDRFPHFVDPYVTRLDRLGPVTVNGLYSAGYFTGKLGLVTWDDPNYRYTAEHGYIPALAAHGITLRDKAYIVVPQQIGALGDMTAAVSSAITKFRSEGIDHVIIQDGHAGVWAGTGLTLEWMDQAKSQGYYPRYGENADNSPGANILPSDEQNNLLAITDGDIDASYDAGWHLNSARVKCFQIQAAAGMPVSSSNLNDEGLAAQACDSVFFMQRVINSLSVLSNDAYMQGVSAVGKSFASSVVYGINLFPGRRDGADMERTAQYFSSCTCLKYGGAPYWVD
jgi:hypothetical protein